MEEVFKEVVDFPNYEISNTGKLRHKLKQRYLTGKTDKDGYIQVSICRTEGDIKCKVRYHRLHRLVAIAFLPNLENKPLVDHIDGDKKNNNVNNLRWATYGENTYNKKKWRESKTGVKGVFFEDNRYRVRIKIDKKYVNIGSFKTLEDATNARLDAVKRMYKEFAHTDEGKVFEYS